jgi:amidase
LAIGRGRNQVRGNKPSFTSASIVCGVTGRRLREDLCLEAAEAIEARLGVATPIDPVR